MNINGNEINLSNLEGKTRDDVEKTGKKKLLNIFNAVDSNRDGSISKEEVSVFKESLTQVDTNKDGEVSKKELKKMLKSGSEFATKLLESGKVKASDVIKFVTQLSTSSVGTKAQNLNIEITPATVQESQDAAIDTIQEEVDAGYKLFCDNDEGVIAKSYNDLKELYGSELSKSAVARNLFIKNETAELLRRAKAGTLTKLEYYNCIKENLMQTFPGVEKMSEEKLQKLADMINSMSPEQIARAQKRILELPSPDSADYEVKAAEFVEGFISETTTKNTSSVSNSEVGISETSVSYDVNQPYEINNGHELMSFEEVFKTRNGVEFNQEKVEKYNQLSSQYALQQTFNAIKTSVHQALDEVSSDDGIEKAILEILNSMSEAKGDADLTRVLQNMTKLENVSVQDGKIIASDMQAVKQALLAYIDAQVEEVNGGKSFEELSVNLEKAYKDAYGEQNVELMAKAYVAEQNKFVQDVRKTVEYGGAALAIIGMFTCPPLAIGAGLVGSFGGAGIEMLEETTKDKPSDEKIAALNKELQVNAALFVAGMGSGIIGSGVGAIASQVATKCKVLTSLIAERGVDATLSLLSTMAITGELDLQGVSIGQLLAVVSGLKSAKVGVKNAAQQSDNMGIAWQPSKSGNFSKFFGPRDINPNSPLNKYKPSQKTYDKSHLDFFVENPHLFEGLNVSEDWVSSRPSDGRHGAWKMHLFSVSEADWQKMADVIIPYLREQDIDWKTFNVISPADCLNGSAQQGKAFTIYPRDKAHFEQIARDLDYIIRNNKLETSDTSITGDRQLGGTGRIFYRYEYKSKSQQNDVLDLYDRAQAIKYEDDYYDSNAARIRRNGEASYLADDMTPADDPWRNFDPANPSSHPASSSNSQRVQGARSVSSGVEEIMTQGEYYQVDGKTQLILADQVCIDFNSSYIRSVIDQMPEGTSIYVGRSSDCAIRIKPECTAVSRYHLIITKSGGRIFVRDISTNGSTICQ